MESNQLSSSEDAVSVTQNEEFIDEKHQKVDKGLDEIAYETIDAMEEDIYSTGCALKSEVTDETSLVGRTCEKQKASSEPGERGGREKRPRRRRNNHKNLEARSSCIENGEEAKKTGSEYAPCDYENRGTKCGREAKNTYSIKEMEAMRFLDLEAQKKRWLEEYCGLSPTTQKEYDALVNSDLQNQNQVDFDPRKQFQSKQINHGVRGEDGSQVVDNVIESVNPSDPNFECTEEEEDSDDDWNSILRPAFFVSGEPRFDSGPPQDGLEYLRRVRWEAERIPKVKVVKLEKKKLIKEQTLYMPNIPDIAKCPEHLLPMKEWEDAFLADFSELRLAFSSVDNSNASSSSILKLPPAINEQEINSLSLGDVEEKMNNLISNEFESSDDPNSPSVVNENTDCKTSISSSSKEIPTLSVILKMDSVARLSSLRKRINSVENMSFISKDEFKWLFALCVAVDTPLDGDMSASLRCLLRKVASLRAEKTQIDDEVIMLNIIATISGKYFGQSG